MRVLWFTNDPMPAVCERMGWPVGGSGSWMATLLDELVQTPGVQAEIATLYPGVRDDQFEANGVRYVVVGQPKLPGIFFECRKRDLATCVELVRERAPDLVHIHGTERFYGLMSARGLISAPTTISLQGLLGPYLSAFFGALSLEDRWRSNRPIELATQRGLFWTYRSFVQGARSEQEILAGAKSFMGRTEWDRAHIRGANVNADYYHVGEILRPEFREKCWSLSRCDRRSVIFTNAGEPRRGTEILLEAIAIVRREFPDVKLRLAGGIGRKRGYERFLRRRIAAKGLSDAVQLLGYLDASAMATELCRAHVFAISSYLENSPNSLCEAMQIGLPCVASYAGGMPSLVQHGQTGLLFPPGDAALLADMILRVFRDDDLTRRLSFAARTEASERHAPKRVLSQLLNAYENVVARDGQPHYTEAVSRS